MMRTLWFVAGATSGVYAMVKARRAAEALTPDGLRDRLAGLSVGLHLFTDEVRTEMASREIELRRQLGLGLDGEHTPALEAARGEDDRPLELTRKGNS